MEEKLHFYKVKPSQILSRIITMSVEQRGQWITDFAIDLERCDLQTAKTDLAKELIKEAKEYRKKRSKAGKLGGLAKASNAKAKPSKTLANSSSSSSTKKHKPYTDDFLYFWEEYPRKEKKSEAFKSWQKIDKDLHPAIMSALRIFKKSKEWQKDNGSFIPHPTTWLNQRRWEDDVVVDNKEKNNVEWLPHCGDVSL